MWPTPRPACRRVAGSTCSLAAGATRWCSGPAAASRTPRPELDQLADEPGEERRDRRAARQPRGAHQRRHQRRTARAAVRAVGSAGLTPMWPSAPVYIIETDPCQCPD